MTDTALELKTGIQLVKDGVWLVPPEQRPPNWQTMPIKEPEGFAPITEVSVVVANSASELPGLQAPLLPWAQAKLAESKAEYTELDEAAMQAKARKWNPHAIRRAATKALLRVTFYEKIVAALEAGYMLFPPVPNADCIAVRVGEEVTEFEDRYRTTGQYETSAGGTVDAGRLPVGEGKYINPAVRWTLIRKYEVEQNGRKTQHKEWKSLDLENPPFPIAMAKPTIVEATSAAMEMKIFDEIRMFPFERRPKGDPCILGSIAMQESKFNIRRLYFLISWRINQTDI